MNTQRFYIHFLCGSQRQLYNVNHCRYACMFVDGSNPWYGLNHIRLVYGGKTIAEDTKNQIALKARPYKLGDVRITIRQGFSLEEAEQNIQYQIGRK